MNITFVDDCRQRRESLTRILALSRVNAKVAWITSYAAFLTAEHKPCDLLMLDHDMCDGRDEMADMYTSCPNSPAPISESIFAPCRCLGGTGVVQDIIDNNRYRDAKLIIVHTLNPHGAKTMTERLVSNKYPAQVLPVTSWDELTAYLRLVDRGEIG